VLPPCRTSRRPFRAHGRQRCPHVHARHERTDMW
jgi:hypothetical protein